MPRQRLPELSGTVAEIRSSLGNTFCDRGHAIRFLATTRSTTTLLDVPVATRRDTPKLR